MSRASSAASKRSTSGTATRTSAISRSTPTASVRRSSSSSTRPSAHRRHLSRTISFSDSVAAVSRIVFAALRLLFWVGCSATRALSDWLKRRLGRATRRSSQRKCGRRFVRAFSRSCKENAQFTVDIYRRNLQRAYVDLLSSAVTSGSVDSDRVGLARQQLKVIRALVSTSREAAADDATRAHLEDLASRVAQALDPQARGGSSARFFTTEEDAVPERGCCWRSARRVCP